MSLWNSPLRSWFCRKFWTLRRKEIPMKSAGFRSVKALVTKWLHWLEMPRSCPCVTDVALMLLACSWSCGPSCHPECYLCTGWHQPWRKGPISSWRIRSAVKSMPGSGSLHPRGWDVVMVLPKWAGSSCPVLLSKQPPAAFCPLKALAFLFFWVCTLVCVLLIQHHVPFANGSCWLTIVPAL